MGAQVFKVLSYKTQNRLPSHSKKGDAVKLSPRTQVDLKPLLALKVFQILRTKIFEFGILNIHCLSFQFLLNILVKIVMNLGLGYKLF